MINHVLLLPMLSSGRKRGLLPVGLTYRIHRRSKMSSNRIALFFVKYIIICAAADVQIAVSDALQRGEINHL
ncbi:hypothetical protein NDU88_006715 [Pleurodeles waltl]|uniref:Uncharacterized protein n=1 Tax=Pleurodeles waltl TaxID=8319 RepID=A0AAV7QPT4_PLEWA|nr:hypothetical protein NDU88_006715 [Pleurodeles waltl]